MRTKKRRGWKQAGPGRPKLYRTKRLCFHLDDDDHEAIVKMAQKDGIKVAELLRTLITWGLESYEHSSTERS